MPITTPVRNVHGERLDVAFTPSRVATASAEATSSVLEDGTGRPLVVIGHGVTSHHDRPYLVALSEALADAGLASLRMSFSGNGDSEGRFADSTISKEVADLGAVLDACDGWRVGYLGHSMGAAVGALRAAIDPRLAALVSLAGMTHVERFMRRHFGHLTPGRDVMLEREHAALTHAFLDDARSIHDVLGPAARVSMPWLIVHGSEDELVPPADSEDLHRAAGAHSVLEVLEGADHCFTDRVGAVCDLVVPWIRSHLRDATPA